MGIRILNRLTGAGVIIFNLVSFLPWTWRILRSGGGPEGWGILLLTTTFSCHLLIGTGVLALLRLQESEKYRRALLIGVGMFMVLSVMNSVFLVGSSYWLFLLCLLTVMLFTTITKLLTVEKTVLAINSFGLVYMGLIEWHFH